MFTDIASAAAVQRLPPPQRRRQDARRRATDSTPLETPRARYREKENVFLLASDVAHGSLEVMRSTTRTLRVVLSDPDLVATVDVLGFHGGAVLYPDAWALLTHQSARRRSGERAEPIGIPGDLFESLPSAVQMLLREHIVDERDLAA